MPFESNACVLDPAKFAPVPIETLYSCDGFEFDLYLQLQKNMPPVLYRQHNFPCGTNDLEQLRAAGQQTLLVPADAYDRYLEYLRDSFLASKTAPPGAMLCALKQLYRSPFVDAMQSVRADKAIDTAREFGQEIAALVESTDEAQSLIAALDHDDSMFTHATNVSVLSTALARKLAIVETNQLAAIATGALLHDLGNRKIATTILNKSGKLTDQERQVVQNHVRLGFEELGQRADLGWSQLMMVYQHHERMDGSGYPVGVSGARIDDWARICAVTTVFSATTCQRPYRRAKTAAEAADLLRDNANESFDRDIVSCFHRLLKPIC